MKRGEPASGINKKVLDQSKGTKAGVNREYPEDTLLCRVYIS